MKLKSRGLTPAFILACLMIVPVYIWILYAGVVLVLYGLFLHSTSTGLPGKDALFLLTSLLPLFVAGLLLTLLLLGIYRKNRVAFGLFVALFPLLVGIGVPFIPALSADFMPFWIVGALYVVTLLIGALFLLELRRDRLR